MMVKQQINIVWLKRDLRLRDHVPLAAAIDNGLPTLLLFCFEPSLMACPESDVRHWRFAFESLADLQNRLKAKEKQLYAVHQEVITVLEWISDFYQIQQVYSHEEVGIKITFDRDKAVKKWCTEQGIAYQEFPQNGIIRGRKHRQGWLKLLEKSTFKASATKVDLEKLQTLSIDPVLLENLLLPHFLQSSKATKKDFSEVVKPMPGGIFNLFYKSAAKITTVNSQNPRGAAPVVAACLPIWLLDASVHAKLYTTLTPTWRSLPTGGTSTIFARACGGVPILSKNWKPTGVWKSPPSIRFLFNWTDKWMAPGSKPGRREKRGFRW